MAAVTPGYGGQSAKRRVGSACAVVAIHAAALLAAFASNFRAEPVDAQAIATFQVAEPGPPAPEPVEEPQPREVVPTPPQPVVIPPPALELPSVSPMVVALLEQADTQAAGGCDLTYPVQVALQTSAVVQDALPTIPDARRSVANAIAVWNQQWVTPDGQLTDTVIDSIKATVATTVAAASESCRAQQQGGPRLIYLPGAAETTVLALGSGTWTWQQVADSAEPEYATIEDTSARSATAAVFGWGSSIKSMFADRERQQERSQLQINNQNSAGE